MSALSVSQPFPIFTDIDGSPLENGYIWIGTANLNPQTSPINVYWDAALTIPATQPIRTLGGYPSNVNTPARLYVDVTSSYSILVQNKNGSLVYSAPAATEREIANNISYTPGPDSLLTTTGVQAALDQLSDDEDGSSYVGFLQAGANAVPTTVQAKLRETVSVLDFGAVGDGVADDTVAIQAALDSGAKKVELAPTGTYKVSSTLTVPSGVLIDGCNSTITSATHFKVLDFASGGGVFNLNMTGAGGGSYVAGSIAIGCSGTNNAPSAPTYVTGPTIENCTISGYGEYGVFLEYVKLAKIKGNVITGLGYTGIGGVSCEDVIVDGNVVKDITAGSAGGDAYGVFIDRKDGASETAEPRSYRCVITNNLIQNISATTANNGQGIDTHAGVDFIIDSNIIKDCEAGIFLTASSISGVQALAPIRCVVSNNTISTNWFVNYGILVYGARTGSVVAQHAEDCVVTGNILIGHGSKTSATVPGVFLSATKNVAVTGNVFKQCGAACLMLDFQNIGVNVSGNEFIDPQSDSFSGAACVYAYSSDNRGYIGGNTYRFENSGLATYVAVNAVRIESALTGLDLDFGRSTFQGIDATHLAFTALTTSGVRNTGMEVQSGSSTIAVSTGGADGIDTVNFAKRFPYVPKVTFTLRRPFNQGGKFPILGIDTVVAIDQTRFRIYALPYDGTTWTATGSLSFDWVAE